ncbi:MAG: polysaccharide deacetylase family protein [Candidatus Woesearchaeota archaeon]
MNFKFSKYLFLIFFLILLYLFFYPKVLLLSFDTEAPTTKEEMNMLLDLLNKYNYSSTFFVTLDFVNMNPELIERMINENHEIACHTKSHKDLTKLNYNEVITEINECKIYIEQNFNTKIYGFRAPYRKLDVSSFYALKSLNFTYDASIFEYYSFAYTPLIKEILTSTFLFIPLDDYICLKFIKIPKNIYFFMLNNYFNPYKSYSFHTHIIMNYKNDFESFLKSQNSKKITHKEFIA